MGVKLRLWNIHFKLLRHIKAEALLKKETLKK